MDIVYLIGNGFDRNLDLETDYRSFYKWYVKEDSNHPAIVKLKAEISGNYENWSDLEAGLGTYFEKLNSVEDSKEIHKDLLNALQRYIAMQDQRFLPQKDYVSNFLNDLFIPYKSLRQNLQNELKRYVFNKNDHIYLHIISFNYTETIERLLQYSGNEMSARSNGSYVRKLRDIEHIHGYCDPLKGRMALGLDNETQIKNTELASNRYVVSRFVKPKYNSLYGQDHHKKCLRWINEASFICIFGMSLGLSDETWWHAIGKRLKSSDARLLYFYHEGFELQNNNGPEFQEQIDEVKDSLLSILGIENINDQDIRSRIYISCCKTMFKYIS